ncbi:uncharacterized protein LOC125494812 [Beta vulgaris subsp. vulgaris]|uniref:uncharacterized protein LOC125494812 n=1 Tax=Beta vulgaris subsp. vulgaris TaxID=3555 RepID=UPI002548AD30|nr:uncharacterized protein LOC125494812 [Beta vulgaris subsp. vulgaris]
MAPFEALYGRKCRSPICWNDISETIVLGPEFVEDTVKQVRLIQEKIRAAQDRQKSYADLKRSDEEYEVGESVLLKVSPTKGVMRFGKRDSSHVLQPESIELDETLTYEERPIKILDSKVRSTRNKDVKLLKVLWSNHKTEEATWEAEDEMRRKYPELFIKVDLDLGNYERFLDVTLTRDNNITTGKIYQSVLISITRFDAFLFV